jgi:hypothetical protein
MNAITNITGVSLPLAVWLASDSYDFSSVGRRAISATSFLKPVRQILLRERLTTKNTITPDVADFIASRLGHAIHDSIEAAWVDGYAIALRKLGYPEKLIERVQINPKVVDPEGIQVWLEQRTERVLLGYTISGKFDMVLDGVLQDNKSTSVYTYMLGSKDDDYCKQGSIYKWLNPDKITSDHMNIQFIFTDWSRAQAKQNPKYPQQRVLEHRVELMSIAETEVWMTRKLRELEKAADLSEDQLPFCSDKDLWRGDDVYKYYSNPLKTDGKSSKNCASASEAAAYMSEKGGKGVVLKVGGKVKACGYCAAFDICTQKELYEHG